jgi:threonine dehydrogenase-like Zn-dependent dehydrogenase
MKALIFHGPGRLSWENAPDPVPGEGEAVVQVEAVGSREIQLVGSFNFTPAEFGQAVGWLGEGRFDPSLLVTGERPMAEGSAIFQELTSHRTEGIKTVLVC